MESLKGYDQWKTTPPDASKEDSIRERVQDFADEAILHWLIDHGIQLDDKSRTALDDIVVDQIINGDASL